MSDFFGDDFTAELKLYFLDSFILEINKFVDLVDETLWKRIHSEVVEQAKAWAIDAKTNEFMFFSDWLEKYADATSELQTAAEFIFSLKALKQYAESLKTEKDSIELSERNLLTIKSHGKVQFLHCHFGSHSFAIPLLSVVEIIGNLSLYPLPFARKGILGVIPYRGDAIPVINFTEHGFSGAEAHRKFYVVCEHQGAKFSLQVTKTEDLIDMKNADIQSVESQSHLIKTSFVKSFFIKGDQSIMIIDLQELVAA